MALNFFGLVDNETKILVNYVPYQGRNSNIGFADDPKNYGLGGAVILKLLEPYVGMNRKIVMDNWFSSPLLAKRLLDLHTYSLATLRKNRKFTPKMTSRLSKGQIENYVTDNIMIERYEISSQFAPFGNLTDYLTLLSNCSLDGVTIAKFV